MSDVLPSVTVVIAARPGQAQVQAVAAAQKLNYPGERLELLVARGRQPSAQRNAALQRASGEWIYFLDDDSLPDPDNLNRAAACFANERVQMIGGPNLCPHNAPWIEQLFALVLASWALGPSRARYAMVGGPRPTSEKELILCNLLARRSAMLELGGFNEALYPNEENALMDELQKRGGILMYDPAILVYRRPRSNLKAFARMLMTYGRGRAEQFRLHPTAGSALNFAPPLFCIYLLGVLIAVLAVPSVAKILLVPLAVYAVVVLVIGAALVNVRASLPQQAPAGQRPSIGVRLARAVCALPLIVLTHLLYGAGFWRGLFTPLQAEPEKRAEVELETIKKLGAVEFASAKPPSQ